MACTGLKTRSVSHFWNGTLLPCCRLPKNWLDAIINKNKMGGPRSPPFSKSNGLDLAVFTPLKNKTVVFRYPGLKFCVNRPLDSP